MTVRLRSFLYAAPLVACAACSWLAPSAESGPPDVNTRDDRRAEAFHKAYLLERQQNYTGAIEALRSASRDSHGYLASNKMAWLYYCAGNYANSRREYSLATRINPASLEPWVTAQLPLLAQQRYSEVEQTARQALAVDPSHYYSNLRQSYACRMQGKYGPAQKINRRMLTLYPSDFNFLLEQAQTLIAQGEVEEARWRLLDALRVAPTNTFIQKLLFTLSGAAPTTGVQAAFAKSAELEAALKYQEAAQTLAAVSPERPESYFHQLRLGWLNYLAGEYEVSKRHYERAADLAPKAVEPLIGLLAPLIAANRFLLAELTAREILELDPKNYTANLRLGYVLRMQGRYADAEKVVAGMLALYPSDVSLLLEQALAIDAQGRWPAARGFYQQVRLLDPDNAIAREALAQSVAVVQE